MAHLQAIYEPGQAIETDTDESVSRVQWVQEMEEEFVESISEA